MVHSIFTAGEQHGSDCWISHSFNRTIVLLIDGLRYDFADYNEFLKREETKHYLNKMPIFNEILNPKRGKINLKIIIDYQNM